MHREFTKLLPDAEGASNFVISVFADIRGFSAFSQERESPDTAMYIKRIYRALTEKYFPYGSFFKPTGDGLMIIVPFSENTVQEQSAAVVAGAITCCTEFAALCNDDPMINFAVPSSIGFGISRGTACRLYSGDKTLDYSGRLLNLSARLTSLARPGGIVLDGDFKLALIPEAQRERFREQNVYLRGIYESEPHPVYLFDTVTAVPQENLRPLSEPNWRRAESEKDIATLRKLGPQFLLRLPSSPNMDTLVVKVSVPSYKDGKRVKGHRTTYELDLDKEYTLKRDADSFGVNLNLDKIHKMIGSQQLPSSAKVAIKAAYLDA
jgi:class 3 adenylate cyclase